MTRIEKNKPSAGTPRASLFGRFLAGGKEPLIDACYEGQERTRSNPHGIGQMAIVEVASQPLQTPCHHHLRETEARAAVCSRSDRSGSIAAGRLRDGIEARNLRQPSSRWSCDDSLRTRTSSERKLLRDRLPAALGRAARQDFADCLASFLIFLASFASRGGNADGFS